MRLRSLLSVPPRPSSLALLVKLSAALLKASASFWGLMPVEKEAGWGRLEAGEAAVTAAAMRGVLQEKGSFSAEHPLPLLQVHAEVFSPQPELRRCDAHRMPSTTECPQEAGRLTAGLCARSCFHLATVQPEALL